MSARRLAMSIAISAAIVLVGIKLGNAGNWAAGIGVLFPGIMILRPFSEIMLRMHQSIRQLFVGAISTLIYTALLYGLSSSIAAARRR
jgi:hypothetical protein